MEKPRERAVKRGIGALTDSELVAILLRTGTKGKNVLEVADAMLERFDGSFLSMRNKAGVADLSEIDGVGPAKALTIQAALEIGYRIWQESLKEKKFFKRVEDVYEFCKDMTLMNVETVRVMVLDSQLGMVGSRDITTGTANASLIHPREVFGVAVRYPASGVIVIHNHPSGDPRPSGEDERITKRIKEAGEIIGIKLVDHVIVASGGFYSFAQQSQNLF